MKTDITIEKLIETIEDLLHWQRLYDAGESCKRERDESRRDARLIVALAKKQRATRESDTASS